MGLSFTSSGTKKRKKSVSTMKSFSQEHEPSFNNENEENASLDSLKLAFASKNRPIMAWIPRIENASDSNGDVEPQDVVHRPVESASLESNHQHQTLAKRKRPPKGHWHNVINSRPEAFVDNGTSKKKQPRTAKAPRASSNELNAKPNRNKCIPLEAVPNTMPSSTPEEAESIVLPAFRDLVNYDFIGQFVRNDGTKSCVMCGVSCQVLKRKKDCTDGAPSMLLQDKGVCGSCIDSVWVIVGTDTEIRFCAKCKYFRPVGAFQQESRLVKTCHGCLESQRGNQQQKTKKKSSSTEDELVSSDSDSM